MRWIFRILFVLLLLPFALLAILAVFPERWLANSVEGLASRAVGADVEIGAVSVEVFSSTPGLALSDVRISNGSQEHILESGNVTASLAAAELLEGRLVLQDILLEGGSLSIVRHEDGSGNWTELWPVRGEQGAPAVKPSLPDIRRVGIDGLQVRFDDRMTDRQIEVTIEGVGSTTNDSEPLMLVAQGTYNRLPLYLDLKVRVPEGLVMVLSELETVQWDLDFALGEATLEVDGQIDRMENLEGLDSTIAFRAPNQAALEALAGITLPALPVLEIDGTVQKEADEFLIRRLTGRFGDNRIFGDIRVNPATEPPTVYANIDSKVLDLDELINLIVDESADSASEQAVAEDVTSAEEGSLLSEDKFMLPSLTGLFNGAIRMSADQVRSQHVPIESLDVRLEIKEQQIRLVPLDFGLGGGSIEAEVTLDTTVAGADGVVEIRVRGVDLRQVLVDLGVDSSGVGKIGGRAKYAVKGNSVASLVRSADGGLVLLMTGGKLDVLLAELAGVDQASSIEALVDPEKKLTLIECGYLNLLTRSGISTIEPMVLGTEDTVFVADGQFDANSEAFGFTFDPYPKNNSLVSASTSIAITGRYGDVAVTPGPEAPARAAAIAVLAAIASPAAAVLPYLEFGSDGGNDNCNGLVSSLD